MKLQKVKPWIRGDLLSLSEYIWPEFNILEKCLRLKWKSLKFWVSDESCSLFTFKIVIKNTCLTFLAGILYGNNEIAQEHCFLRIKKHYINNNEVIIISIRICALVIITASGCSHYKFTLNNSLTIDWNTVPQV